MALITYDIYKTQSKGNVIGSSMTGYILICVQVLSKHAMGKYWLK